MIIGGGISAWNLQLPSLQEGSGVREHPGARAESLALNYLQPRRSGDGEIKSGGCFKGTLELKGAQFCLLMVSNSLLCIYSVKNGSFTQMNLHLDMDLEACNNLQSSRGKEVSVNPAESRVR